MTSYKKITIRDAEGTLDQIAYYAAAHDMTQQDAAIRLLRLGLMAENDGLYTTDLSRALTASVREELASVTYAIRSELRDVTDAIDERLTSAEAASYASLFATLKGTVDVPANDAADIFAVAGARYASGAENMTDALRMAEKLHELGDVR